MTAFLNKYLQKKSLKERFLLVISTVLFFMYLIMGVAIIFWEKMPLDMVFGYRIALGTILIVYAFIRFIRFFKK